jgi:copper(I)-binding protein
MNSTKTLRGLATILVSAAALLSGAPALAEVVGSEAWTRATPPGTDTAVGYLVLTNHGDEDAKLLKIVSPVCDKIMIHRSTVDSTGVARMWPVAKLEIAPGQSVRFEPNGLHIMFMELKQPFVVGQKVPLQLTFEGEKEFTVLLDVKALVPDAGMDHDAIHHDQVGRK